jgi:hypothetical protein
MQKHFTLPQVFGLGLLLTALTSCATARTTYTGVPVTALTDEQLVTELQSAATGFGLAFDRTMYLMAVRPEPAYVLTSSTTHLVGSADATYSAYVMPGGYGATMSGTATGTVHGTATTRYQYTDVNATARQVNAIATAISRFRQEAYRRRALEVLSEYQRRVTARRLETERVIEDFFTQNPDLQSRRPLVAVIAPWAAAEGRPDGRAILQRTREIISTLPRGLGLSGTWYGTFTQTNTSPRGETITFSEFVRLSLQQDGPTLTGRGVLGSGDNIELSGTVTDQDISAAVANTTSAINVKMTAIAAPSQITGSFVGFGAGTRIEGMFTLLR